MATLTIPKRVKLLGNTLLAAKYIKLADNLLFLLKQTARTPQSFNTVTLADGTVIRVGITGISSEVTIDAPWPKEKDEKELEEEEEVTLYYTVCGEGYIVLTKDPETLLTEFNIKIKVGEKGPEIEAVSEDESIIFCKWLSSNESLEDAEFIPNIYEIETCEDLENISCDVDELYKNPIRPAVKVKRDTVFIALFRKQFKLTYSAEEGGFIQGETEQYILQGDDGEEVIAQANENYSFIKWSDNIETAARTDLNIQDNLEVSALFTYVPPVYYYYITLQYFDETWPLTPSVGDNTSFIMRAFDEGFNFPATGTWNGEYWVIPVSRNVPHWITRTGQFNFVDRSPYVSGGSPSYSYPQHEIIRNTLYTQYPGKYKVSTFYTDTADCIMPGYYTFNVHYLDTQWWKNNDGSPIFWYPNRNIRINSSVPYIIKSKLDRLTYIDFIFHKEGEEFTEYSSLSFLMNYTCNPPNPVLTSVDYPWSFTSINHTISGVINSCSSYPSEANIEPWDFTLHRSPEDYTWETGFTVPYGTANPVIRQDMPNKGPVAAAQFHDFEGQYYGEDYIPDKITISVDYGD